MATSRASAKFNKQAILKQLRDAQAFTEASLKTYEEQIESWKANAPIRFQQAVEEWSPENSWLDVEKFKPPKRTRACEDWRVNALSKAIIRIDAMTPDEKDGMSITLRLDDNIWDYVVICQ